jgi:hypothetical protein
MKFIFECTALQPMIIPCGSGFIQVFGVNLNENKWRVERCKELIRRMCLRK